MSYPGSKGQAGTFQTIIGQMPEHTVYVEPFLGSGQVFHRKRPADTSVICDKNPECIPDNCSMVITPDEWLGVASGCRLIAIYGDAFQVLKKCLHFGTEALIYCDPPYPLDTRQGRLYYEHEFTDDQHTSLLALLQGMKCPVMISGVPCPLYLEALQSWRCVQYRTKWHRKVATECLWMNFPEPEQLHDWRFAGKNHRDRVSLKRLAARWLAKLDAMKPRKRGYVLNAIKNSIAQRQQ